MEKFTHDDLQLVKYVLNKTIKDLSKNRRNAPKEYHSSIDISISIIKELEEKLDDSIRNFRID